MGYEDEQRQWMERALASAPEITDEQRREARRVRRHYARAKGEQRDDVKVPPL